MQGTRVHGMKAIADFLNTAQSAETARRNSQTPASNFHVPEEKRLLVSKVKGMICDPKGNLADVLKMGKEMRTTLGMHIALNSGIDHMLPRQVQSVIPVREDHGSLLCA